MVTFIHNSFNQTAIHINVIYPLVQEIHDYKIVEGVEWKLWQISNEVEMRRVVMRYGWGGGGAGADHLVE